jgi:hypothetical protein
MEIKVVEMCFIVNHRCEYISSTDSCNFKEMLWMENLLQELDMK